MTLYVTSSAMDKNNGAAGKPGTGAGQFSFQCGIGCCRLSVAGTNALVSAVERIAQGKRVIGNQVVELVSIRYKFAAFVNLQAVCAFHCLHHNGCTSPIKSHIAGTPPCSARIATSDTTEPLPRRISVPGLFTSPPFSGCT